MGRDFTGEHKARMDFNDAARDLSEAWEEASAAFRSEKLRVETRLDVGIYTLRWTRTNSGWALTIEDKRSGERMKPAERAPVEARIQCGRVLAQLLEMARTGTCEQIAEMRSVSATVRGVAALAAGDAEN